MNDMKILAWFGDPELKAQVVAKVKEHRRKDEITQGIYQDWLTDQYQLAQNDAERTVAKSFKGCAIGCTLPPIPFAQRHRSSFSWHKEMERHYAIPEAIARMIDNIFEIQDEFEEAARFAVAVVEAIPVGADLFSLTCATYDEDGELEFLCNDCIGCRWQNDEAVTASEFLDALANAPVPVTEKENVTT